ncbi:unnamed protein product [Amoebophrya sp. A120]|nr:unnamed protein product [Amoebophrya sp. A120]|eukprot:GSA120T00015340001.1
MSRTKASALFSFVMLPLLHVVCVSLLQSSVSAREYTPPMPIQASCSTQGSNSPRRSYERRIWALTGWGMNSNSTRATVSYWVEHHQKRLGMDPRYFIVLLFSPTVGRAKKFADQALCGPHGYYDDTERGEGEGEAYPRDSAHVPHDDVITGSGKKINKQASQRKTSRTTGICDNVFVDLEPYSVKKMVFDRFYILNEVGVQPQDWVLQADGDEFAMFPGMKLYPKRPTPLVALVDDLEANGENAMFALLAERIGRNGDLEQPIVDYGAGTFLHTMVAPTLPVSCSATKLLRPSLWEQFPLNCALQLLTMDADPLKVILFRGHLRSAGHDVFARVFAGGFPTLAHLPELWAKRVNLDKTSEDFLPHLPPATWQFEVDLAKPNNITRSKSRSTMTSPTHPPRVAPFSKEKLNYVVFPELQVHGSHNILLPRVGYEKRKEAKTARIKVARKKIVESSSGTKNATVEAGSSSFSTGVIHEATSREEELKERLVDAEVDEVVDDWEDHWPAHRHARNLLQELQYVESGGSDRDFQKMKAHLGDEVFQLLPTPDNPVVYNSDFYDESQQQRSSEARVHERSVEGIRRAQQKGHSTHTSTAPAVLQNYEEEDEFFARELLEDEMHNEKRRSQGVQGHATLGQQPHWVKGSRDVHALTNPDPERDGTIPLWMQNFADHPANELRPRVFFVRPHPTLVVLFHFKWTAGVAQKHTSLADSEALYTEFANQGGYALESGKYMSKQDQNDFCLRVPEATPGRLNIPEKLALFSEPPPGASPLRGPYDTPEAVALTDVFLLRLFVFGWARYMTDWQKSEGGAW